MALPAAGLPISFKDINDELGNSSQATLDLKSASEDLGEPEAPYGMDELAGLSNDGITFLAFSADQGSGQGEIDVSWTLSTPSGVTMATNGFTLSGSANSDMSSPVIELQNSNGGGSPFTDTSLGNNTTRYYRANTTTTAGTFVESSIENATTQVAGVDRTLSEMYIYQLDDSGTPPDEVLLFRGWEDDELIQCVNGTQSPTAPTGGGNTLPGDASGDTYTFDSSPDINLSAVGGFSDTNTATINGNQTFGDVTFSDNANFDGNDKFFRNETDLKIHQIGNGTGTISNTISFTPATLTISLVSKTTTSVTVRATGNTQVIDTLRFYRDTTEGTKTDHTKGAVGNTNVTADFTFSGLTPNTSYAFKVRGENNSGTGGAVRVGSDSNTINVTTDQLPIVLSPTSLVANGDGAPLPYVAESGTLTVTYNVSPAGTLKVFVDNTSNCRFKQATTSGGLSSASYGSLSGTNYSGGDTLTLSSGQVFLQFEVTLTSGTSTSKTFTISDNTNSETIVFNVNNISKP